MYARIASFEGGDVDKVKEFGQGQMAAGTALPAGAQRVQLLQDTAANRRLFIVWFDTLANAEAAEAQFEAMGDEVDESVRGTRTSVARYEVVLDGTP